MHMLNWLDMLMFHLMRSTLPLDKNHSPGPYKINVFLKPRKTVNGYQEPILYAVRSVKSKYLSVVSEGVVVVSYIADYFKLWNLTNHVIRST